MTKTILKVENLGKEYVIGKKPHSLGIKATLKSILPSQRKKNVFWALKDINFEVKEGEVLGIIGPNGAGKSTLLKILSRITAPTTGKVSILGRVSSLLEVGTGFHPELTGRENIYLNGTILGMERSEIKEKFDEIVAFADIGKFLDTPVKHYSSGMYVRLAFAVAAHLEPEILIIDEVLAVGDLQFQKKCLGKMKDVSKGGRTVLFVSHNLGAVSNLCERSILLDKGRLKFIGKTDKCIAKYVHQSKSHKGNVIWKNVKSAPGSRNVKLHSVKIISDAKTTGSVLINKEIVIEITYWNLKDAAKLASSFHLKDALGSLILASANFPSASLVKDEWYDKKMKKGLYKATCIIPANFLNDGQYSLDIGIVDQYKNEFEFNLTDTISFQVVESGEMRKEYMGQWTGAVRPKLLWKTVSIKE